MGKRCYVIFAPEFVPNSAGIRSMYVLAHVLRQKGHQVYMTGTTQPPPKDTGIRVSVIPLRDARAIARWSDCVAVYPETIAGNPLGAVRVARWVLNKPGYLGGSDIYPEGEMVFVYSDVYVQYLKNKVDGKLYMPTIDRKIFFPSPIPAKDRLLTCFYVGKSTWKDGYVDPSTSFEITRMSPAKSDLGKLFRMCKALYCFDNSSILAYEAISCGCPAIVIPDGTHSRQDYERLELGMDGLAWGPEELDRAAATVDTFWDRYSALEKDFDRQLDEFVEKTQAGKFAQNLDKCPQCRALSYELRAAQAEIDLLHSQLHQYRRSFYFRMRRKLSKSRVDVLLAWFGRFFLREKKVETPTMLAGTEHLLVEAPKPKDDDLPPMPT